METNLENTDTQASNKRERTRYNRANIAPELYAIFEDGQRELQERAVEVNFVTFSKIIAKHLPKDIGKRFVEDATPAEWHLKSMMENPQYKQEFLKLAEKLKKK